LASGRYVSEFAMMIFNNETPSSNSVGGEIIYDQQQC
jgi:hypothetical protein